MTGYDRQLFILIEELTDCGMVMSPQSTIDYWGREHTKRVLADGFAVIRRGGADLDDANFLDAEEAHVVIDHLRKTDDYANIEGPWAPIGPEDEFDLIRRYAADDPEAVAEVRRRHAERRATLCP